ncbi:MAG: hypothetical protein K6G42_01085 [Lachnospiraceae bacterium]|nr:hypothetical protein [Lachnospiraceae bacterium]
MAMAAAATGLIALNFILYFLFGSVLTASGKREMSLTRTVFAGLFFYYLLFTLCCIPVMLRWRPLHVLKYIWLAVLIIFSAVGAFRARRRAIKAVRKAFGFAASHKTEFIVIAVITIVFAATVLINYQFTLDASYYVGSATTAIQTDTINMYDPFTGDWLDHYEMRYFFATFPMNDAVMCSLLGLHPLLWCKITMAGTAIIMTVMVLYMLGRSLFDTDTIKITLFILFSVVANFFMITIYTTSAFLTTRTYEGKCLLANVVLPGILYIYTCLLRDNKEMRNWLLLMLVALGAPVLSSSANMLVPAMIGVTIIPLTLLKKDLTVIPRSLVCMIPGITLTVIYILYVKNIVVFYTYPR